MANLIYPLHRMLAVNVLSRLAGRLYRISLKGAPGRMLVRMFAAIVGADLREAELPLSEYHSIHDFFIRRLKPSLRPNAAPVNAAVSPVDGTLRAITRIEHRTVMQVKGQQFELDDLIRNRVWAPRFRNGVCANLYLAPRDYHRMHAPVRGAIVAWEHVPGRLFTVNDSGLARVPRLFCRNERVTVFFDTRYGAVAMVMVGASFVGSIRVDFLDLRTNRARAEYRYQDLTKDDQPQLERGQEFARFELGSTVLLLFEQGMLQSEGMHAAGDIRLRELLALFPPATEKAG